MTRKWTLLSFGLLIALGLSPSTSHGADTVAMAITGLTGTLQIQQHIPCSQTLNQTTDVTAGMITLTPAEGVDVPGGKLFALTRASLAFAPFSLSGTCHLFSRTRAYSALNVDLARAVSFVAAPAGGGVYSVTIPKDDFLIFEAAIVNNDPENGYKHPSEDVTGTIDLTNGTVQMHVVLATLVHFDLGISSEDDPGTLTADLTC